MKAIKLAACAALASTCLTTPATAAITPTSTPSTAVTAEMTTQCAAYLASLNTTYAPREFTSVAVENVTYTITWNSTPTSSTPDNSTRQPLGTVTGFSNLSFENVTEASLGRTGGSPNMFSNAVTAHTVSYSNSSVQVTDTYDGTVNYGYFCTPTEKVTTPALGLHKWTGPTRAGDPAKENCESINSGAHVDSDRGANCEWEQTQAGGTDYVVRTELSYGYPFGGVGAVTASIQGTDTRTDTNAGPWTFENQNLAVTALVCNNPGSKGGTWRNANGYTGGLCTPITNAFYTNAPTLAGNNFGTLYPSNSVPQ